MEKLKLYAAPLIAVVLILAWYFVVRPMLDGSEPAPTDKAEQKAEQKADAKQAQ